MFQHSPDIIKFLKQLQESFNYCGLYIEMKRFRIQTLNPTTERFNFKTSRVTTGFDSFRLDVHTSLLELSKTYLSFTDSDNRNDRN